MVSNEKALANCNSLKLYDAFCFPAIITRHKISDTVRNIQPNGHIHSFYAPGVEEQINLLNQQTIPFEFVV